MAFHHTKVLIYYLHGKETILLFRYSGHIGAEVIREPNFFYETAFAGSRLKFQRGESLLACYFPYIFNEKAPIGPTYKSGLAGIYFDFRKSPRIWRTLSSMRK